MSLRPSNTLERRIIIPDQQQAYANNYESQQNYHPYAHIKQNKNGIQKKGNVNRMLYQKQMQQQVTTPSWANNNNIKAQQLEFKNNGFKAKNSNTGVKKTTNISNISRLDQLLSKNQLIYQHMRNQLQEISRSNQNINNNINIIKPLSQSQAQQLERQQYESIQRNRKLQRLYGNVQSNSQFKQPFTFTSNSNQMIKQQQSSQNSMRKSHKKHMNNVYLHSNVVTSSSNQDRNSNQSNDNTSQKYRIVVNDTTKKQKKFNIPTQSSEYVHHNHLLQPQKKQIYKVTKLHQKSSTYYEPDSSPVASEMLASIQNNKINKNHQFNLQLYKMSDGSKVGTIANNKYQTFQQEDGLNNLQLNTNKSGKNIDIRNQNWKENTLKQKKFNITPKKLNMSQQKQSTKTKKQQQIKIGEQQQLKWRPQIAPISIAFVPFNKLYSSPILQLSNKNQLILARKSKTQLTTNTSTNRIVNGIKYKNVNLIHDEIRLYETIVNHSRKIQQVLQNNMKIMDSYMTNKESTQNMQNYKNSIDIGIVGGQNTLKKKLHFSMLAHIYAQIIQFIQRLTGSYLQMQTQQYNTDNENNNEQIEQNKRFIPMILGIQHQQQQSLGDPYMIKYQGQIGLSEIQNQIVYANIRAAIQQIFSCMKMKLSNGEQKNNEPTTYSNGNISNTIYSVNKNSESRNHRIRVTKLYLKYQPIFTKQQVTSNTFEQQKQNSKFAYDTLYSTKIISTNKISRQLIQSLQLDSVVWCVNPLYKYYQQTKQCLDCYNQYKSTNKNKKEMY